MTKGENNMSNRRLVIAGTGSGVGKTTLTIGLMAALRQAGYRVQGFKCGPDYIDPTYHTAVTERTSRNIDSWMLEHDMVREIVARASEDADISIMEGVMGFFDGKNPLTNEGTTAEISLITNSPVLLVVNCASMARSAAAIVKGFQQFLPEANIVGVIANRVGSEGHYKLVKAAIEQECHIPVVGYLKRNDDLTIPERHLGLIPSIERGELTPFFEQLGKLVHDTIDIEKVYELALAPKIEINDPIFTKPSVPQVKIAVARDAAFNFYYEENFELLKAYGAELVEFSPLKGEVVPQDADGLYIGGGFPEEFAETLAQQIDVKNSVRAAIQKGIPTLAECGGFMFLTDGIVTTDDTCHEMVGLIPGQVRMQTKLAALGYREVTGKQGNFLFKGDIQAKGHEFHYSTFHSEKEFSPAYDTKGMRGMKEEGYMNNNLIAGYTHFHFGSSTKIVENWVEQCKAVKKERRDAV